MNRRHFLGYASAAGLAPLLVSQAPVPEPSKSGLVTGEPQPLPYDEIPGFLSKEQVRWHHESHYGGALKGFVELDGKLPGQHRPRIAKANSVLLHEFYFENMTRKAPNPGPKARELLAARFGSFEQWADDFKTAAKGAAGWAVLTLHPVNRRLYNVASDSHDDGPAVAGLPVLVVDMYEHAYYIDFQNRRGDYIDRFMAHVEWDVVERRLADGLG